MEAFYTFNERFAKIRSKRIEKAVKGITGSKSSALMDGTPQQSSGRGKKRKVKPHEDEGNQLEVDSTGVDGAATSNKDNSVKPTTKKKNSRSVDGHGISGNESRAGRSQRGRGRGQSGRGRKKAERGTSYDDAGSSENDEEMQSHASEDAHQLRRVSHFVCARDCVYKQCCLFICFMHFMETSYPISSQGDFGRM